MNPIVLAAQEVIYFKHYCKLWTTEGLICGKWRAFLLVAVLVTNRGKDIIFSIGVKSNQVFTLMKRHTSYYASGISGWLVASQNLLFYFHVSPHPLEVVVIYVNIFFLNLILHIKTWNAQFIKQGSQGYWKYLFPCFIYASETPLPYYFP